MRKLEAIKTRNEGFQAPLSRETLAFASEDGKLIYTTTLADRMQKFKEVVAAEEEKLEILGKQWAEVQQSITELALEVLGPNGLERLQKLHSQEVPDSVDTEQAAFAEEIRCKGKRWEKEAAHLNEHFLEQIKASEEV